LSGNDLSSLPLFIGQAELKFVGAMDFWHRATAVWFGSVSWGSRASNWGEISGLAEPAAASILIARACEENHDSGMAGS